VYGIEVARFLTLLAGGATDAADFACLTAFIAVVTYDQHFLVTRDYLDQAARAGLHTKGATRALVPVNPAPAVLVNDDRVDRTYIPARPEPDAPVLAAFPSTGDQLGGGAGPDALVNRFGG
jgi:hypothetical protein